jgi:hypothetical protein
LGLTKILVLWLEAFNVSHGGERRELRTHWPRVAKLILVQTRILPVTFTKVAAEDLQRELINMGVPDDRYGNTTGWVGGKYMSTYSDSYGGTTGTIGNKRITTYEDGYGNTTGTIGRDRINLYTDPSGTTTGTIGRRRLNCYTDRFRTTTCN